jgi:hypothetical protein
MMTTEMALVQSYPSINRSEGYFCSGDLLPLLQNWRHRGIDETAGVTPADQRNKAGIEPEMPSGPQAKGLLPCLPCEGQEAASPAEYRSTPCGLEVYLITPALANTARPLTSFHNLYNFSTPT